jgi:tetratricopeptide (TPR) repeat protein
MWLEAARFRERLGDLDRAAELYGKAQLPLDVGRIYELRGRRREAGVVYEKFLASAVDSPDEADRAHYALGKILGGFQRHEEAVRHLQQISADSKLHVPARRTLVLELAELGYSEAADQVLELLRKEDATLPPLDAFVRVEKATRRLALEQKGSDAPVLGGRYRILRLIGSGGFGRVYLASDELKALEVALKVVAPPVDAKMAENYRRFVREAKVVSQLKHPNILQVFEFHEEFGLMAMEYLPGGTLQDRLTAPLTPLSTRTLALEILSALEAAHAHGVIHRDIKPANIFFTASGDAKLGDFGVAHLLDMGATQTAGFIGTLAYMSPEQISAAPLHFSTDLYALGVTLFQALTGRLPFTGPDFVGQHLGEKPPRPSSLRPLDAGWDALLIKMLEKTPAARFASIDELRRALMAIVLEPADPKSAPAAQPAVAAPERARHVFIAELLRTDHSRLEQAEDTRLGRPVWIERFAASYFASEKGQAHMSWLRAMARHGGPHLQRVLSIARQGDETLVIYEAVAGAPWRAPGDEKTAADIVAALVPLHQSGVAHGSVRRSVVLEDFGATLLVAGRAPTGAAPKADLDALQKAG